MQSQVGEGLGGFGAEGGLWCRARSGSTGFRRRLWRRSGRLWCRARSGSTGALRRPWCKAKSGSTGFGEGCREGPGEGFGNLWCRARSGSNKFSRVSSAWLRSRRQKGLIKIKCCSCWGSRRSLFLDITASIEAFQTKQCYIFLKECPPCLRNVSFFDVMLHYIIFFKVCYCFKCILHRLRGISYWSNQKCQFPSASGLVYPERFVAKTKISEGCLALPAACPIDARRGAEKSMLCLQTSRRQLFLLEAFTPSANAKDANVYWNLFV